MSESSDVAAEAGQANDLRCLSTERLVLDRLNHSVTLDGEQVALRPTPFKLLWTLMANAELVLSKSDLLEAVWDGVIVGDEVLTTAIRDIRRALGDDARNPHFIRTVSRRGYVFVQPVQTGERPVTAAPVPDAASLSRRYAAIVMTVMVCMLIVGSLSWMAVRSNGQAEFRAHLPLALPATVEVRFPTLLAAIQDEARRTGAIAGHGRRAGYEMMLTLPDTETAALMSVQLRLGRDGEAIHAFELDVSNADSSGLARRVVLTAADLLHCAEDIHALLLPVNQRDPTISSLVFALCETSRQANSPYDQVHASESLLAAIPDDPGAKALHAIMLASRPDQHLFGRVDPRAEEFEQQTARLLAEARAAQGPEWAIDLGQRLLTARQSSLVEQAALFDGIPANDWVSMRVLFWRIVLMRRSGRLADASYMAEQARSRWPTNSEFWILLSLTQTMRGLHAESAATLEEAQALMPEIASFSRVLARNLAFYGSETDARTRGMDGAPPHIVTCMNAYHDARFGDVGRIGSACDVLDPSQRAKLFAMTGDTDMALQLIEGFDPEAAGLGITLHYSEFFPLWETPGMWEVAERFGLPEFWRQTGVRPDMCFQERLRVICEERI